MISLTVRWSSIRRFCRAASRNESIPKVPAPTTSRQATIPKSFFHRPIMIHPTPKKTGAHHELVGNRKPYSHQATAHRIQGEIACCSSESHGRKKSRFVSHNQGNGETGPC